MVTIEYLLNFLREDTPFGDITSETIIPDITCRAVITTEQPAVVAGLTEAAMLFRHYGIFVETPVPDGSAVTTGDEVLLLEGDARTILMIERTALNIIGRMSGIATLTRHYVDLVQTIRPACRIAATRKTCPGLRELDKKAVLVGGGDPHRWSLSDGVLIKDNHLSLVSLPDAIARAKAFSSYHIIEAEVTSAGDAVLAANAGAGIIMLDNMSPYQVKDTIRLLKKERIRDRITVEVSGGIDEDTLLNYASEEIDAISIGALTHSVKNISVHLDVIRP